jgi:hypothetical protein
MKNNRPPNPLRKETSKLENWKTQTLFQSAKPVSFESVYFGIMRPGQGHEQMNSSFKN